MSTNGTKLLAQGAVVVLKDDMPRRLVLDMEALAVIEERVGSLSIYVEGLNRSFKGKVVRSVIAGLEAGLRHYQNDQGEPQYSRRRVAQLMDFKQMQAYTEALDAAWAEAMPPSPQDARGKGSGRGKRSRGKSSSAEESSSMAEVSESSGE